MPLFAFTRQSEGPTGWAPSLVLSCDPLKQELQAELQYARIFAGFLYLTESRIREIPVRIVELRMVPRIVEFRAEFRVPPFADRRLLGYHQVGVADRWTTAQRVRNIPELARCWVGDIQRTEILVLGSRIFWV